MARSAGAKAGTCEYSKRGVKLLIDSPYIACDERFKPALRTDTEGWIAAVGVAITAVGQARVELDIPWPERATEGSTVGGLPFLLRNTC